MEKIKIIKVNAVPNRIDGQFDGCSHAGDESLNLTLIEMDGREVYVCDDCLTNLKMRALSDKIDARIEPSANCENLSVNVNGCCHYTYANSRYGLNDFFIHETGMGPTFATGVLWRAFEEFSDRMDDSDVEFTFQDKRCKLVLVENPELDKLVFIKYYGDVNRLRLYHVVVASNDDQFPEEIEPAVPNGNTVVLTAFAAEQLSNDRPVARTPLIEEVGEIIKVVATKLTGVARVQAVRQMWESLEPKLEGLTDFVCDVVNMTPTTYAIDFVDQKLEVDIFKFDDDGLLIGNINFNDDEWLQFASGTAVTEQKLYMAYRLYQKNSAK